MRNAELTRVMLVALTVLLWNVSTSNAQNKDILRRTVGGMVAGTIESTSADFVSIKEKSGTTKVPINEIAKVSFGDDPMGMSKVRSDITNGQIEQASERMKKVKVAGRRFVQQDIAFYKALIASRLALKGQANITDAARQMKKFLDKNSDSIRYYEACEVMGDLAMNLGKFDSAAKNYARLARSKSPSTVARGYLRQGDAWLLGGNVQKAGQMYQQAARANEARVKLLGTVGVAKCLASTGKADAAIKQLEKVIAENDSKDVELFARTYNALGHAYKQAGNSNAALDAYLHTDLLFYREMPQHAEALFHLGQLWLVAKKPAEASRARKTLKDRYAASLWAKK